MVQLEILELLANLKIDFSLQEHHAAHTIEEIEAYGV